MLYLQTDFLEYLTWNKASQGRRVYKIEKLEICNEEDSLPVLLSGFLSLPCLLFRPQAGRYLATLSWPAIEQKI